MIQLNNFSHQVWEDNYKAPGENNIEDTWKRLAKSAASIEENPEQMEKEFYSILENFKFVPGGRIMANLGVPGRDATTLFNCFVLHPSDIPELKDPDSIEGIYTMLKYQAHTLKSEGGLGTNFSWVRPKGTYIKGIDSRTPGVLQFMQLWDVSSKTITMGSETIAGEKQTSEKQKIRKNLRHICMS